MTGIIDYGAGNLFSVKNALDFLGEKCVITKNPDELRQADYLILPGVGAFPDAMRMLNESGLVEVIRKQAEVKPLLGICLGMQLLFEKGYEFGETDGLGFIEGSVSLMTPSDELVLPQIGWNELIENEPCKLLNGIKDKYVYFVHSFAAKTDSKNVAAYCDYGGKVTALVQKGNVYGAQFHPEKSGETGLQILRNFVSL